MLWEQRDDGVGNDFVDIWVSSMGLGMVKVEEGWMLVWMGGGFG